MHTKSAIPGIESDDEPENGMTNCGLYRRIAEHYQDLIANGFLKLTPKGLTAVLARLDKQK